MQWQERWRFREEFDARAARERALMNAALQVEEREGLALLVGDEQTGADVVNPSFEWGAQGCAENNTVEKRTLHTLA